METIGNPDRGGKMMTRLRIWWEKRQTARRVQKEVDILKRMAENLNHKGIKY